ncbi:integrase [Pseudomonas sp. PhalM4]
MSTQFFGGLFSGENEFKSLPEGQNGPQGAPADDFVICRNSKGEPTAVYGDDTWDLNPQRLSAKRVTALNFSDIFKGNDPDQIALIAEAKFIVFCLIFYVDSGRLGRLSVGTIYNLFGVVRLMTNYCYAQKDRELVGVLTLEQLLTTPVYLADFFRVSNLKDARRRMARSLIVNLIEIGHERLGYRVYNDGQVVRLESKQHPVIPTRIYLNMINQFSDSLDLIFPYIGRLEQFIKCFSDRAYGLAIESQYERARLAKVTIVDGFRPTMEEAIDFHGLQDFFVGEFECASRKNLPGVINKIQYLIKSTIHCYTGMRDQEVGRLPYDCLDKAEVNPALLDDDGIVRDKATMVDIISTTTKFMGFRNEASWLATSEVVKAVTIAKAICRALASIHKIDVNTVPLMITPGVIYKKDIGVEVPVLGSAFRMKSFLNATVIHSEDLVELAESDPSRDFSSEPEFEVGKPWPVTSHQFRRSLAFYGSSSGFISLPSLKKQFKHLILNMARYYANNFQNIKTIFGFFDPKADKFVLPKNHMAFEFQMGMPMNVAYDILTEVLGDGVKLFGGVGTYIEKQKKRFDSGDVMIAELKAETEKRVADGHLAYRKTLLGGCMKRGRCDSFLLGEFVDCISCDGSVINPKKMSKVIEDMSAELSQYPVGSAEYQITKNDLDKLTKYQERFITCAEVV